MTQFKRQLLSVLTVGSLILTQATTVAAATTIEISGNGSSSDNTAKVEHTTSTTVVQSNNAIINNNVKSTADTGSNKANDNTGGDVMVKTGNAKSDVSVSNTANSNSATVNCCGSNDTTVTVQGNGTRSENKADITQKDANSIFQDNKANINNNVDSKAKTGENDAKRNTGGDVIVNTGDATAKTEVSTTANVNQAKVGGANGEGGSVTAKILGNGSNSDNDVSLKLNKLTTLVQDNYANVRNVVDANAKTGNNNANDNTGGEVAVYTGDAKTHVGIDNMVNFNAAEIDCGCLLDVNAKVHENGTDSENNLKVKLSDEREVFQGGKEGAGNVANLDNGLTADAKTGTNDAKNSTGSTEGSDPFIYTGDAVSMTDVSNTGNVNQYGSDAGMDFPSVDFNFNVSLSMTQLMALLGR